MAPFYANGADEPFGSSSSSRPSRQRMFCCPTSARGAVRPQCQVQSLDGDTELKKKEDLCREGKRGSDRSHLPSPRLVSASFHPDRNVSSRVATLLLMQFGQFLDHDVTLTPEVHGKGGGCCGEGKKSDDCLAILMLKGEQVKKYFFYNHIITFLFCCLLLLFLLLFLLFLPLLFWLLLLFLLLLLLFLLLLFWLFLLLLFCPCCFCS